MATPRQPPLAPASAYRNGAGWRRGRAQGGFGTTQWLVVASLTLLGVLWLWSGSPAEPGDGAAAASTQTPATNGRPAWLAAFPGMSSEPAPEQAPARAPEGDADPTRDLKSYIPRGANPTMPEVIQRLHERGIFSGLGAFSPPGTRPPLVGLAVPEDFDLPKGYVRHHQVTDDGQTIEAILMFAPDFQLVDASNQPVAMPKDRIVPPELAPPGLPHRRITIPAPREPARPGQ
ncbi:hypothetical protein [Rugamonas apoptosis]|uniref:hypothetical protein n=1 Tax=Rugamonas apoptosis TaxID=2758570 RepID=UPI001E32B1B5|nr:hypothetical protein [Rugamonas apoptosis]